MSLFWKNQTTITQQMDGSRKRRKIDAQNMSRQERIREVAESTDAGGILFMDIASKHDEKK